MISIVAGLSAPPIRRLKRTWELVQQRYILQFEQCKTTDENMHTLTGTRRLMTGVAGPCVPFLGEFVSQVLHGK